MKKLFFVALQIVILYSLSSLAVAAGIDPANLHGAFSGGNRDVVTVSFSGQGRLNFYSSRSAERTHRSSGIHSEFSQYSGEDVEYSINGDKINFRTKKYQMSIEFLDDNTIKMTPEYLDGAEPWLLHRKE